VNVVWTRAAIKDRGAIFDHILEIIPQAALRMDEVFSDAADRLASSPRIGAIGRVAGTRELIPHESYRLVYEISAEEVWILAVVRTARRWPSV
jgi:toxin ParE1/3/4